MATRSQDTLAPETVRIAIAGGEVRVHERSAPELERLGLLDPERWRTRAFPGAELQEDARGWVLRLPAPGRALFVKYRRSLGAAPWWRRGLSPAERERRAALSLANLGLATPAVLLAGETRGSLGAVRESFLVTEPLAGAPLERAEPRVASALGRLLVTLSRERVLVPDLYAKHLFLAPERDPELGLLDLERVRLAARKSPRALFLRHAANLVASLPGLDARELARAFEPDRLDELARAIEERADLVRTRKKLPRDYGARARYRDGAEVERYQGRSSSRHAAELALLDALLPRSTSGTVLDAPCGAGRFSEILASRGARVLALDLSPAMLRTAARVAAGAARGELERLPLADRSVEGALCFRFLHHVPSSAQRARILAELTRVSKSFVVVSFFHPWSAHHALRRLRRAALGAPLTRHACTLATLRSELAALGWKVTRTRAQARFRRDLWALRAEPF